MADVCLRFLATWTEASLPSSLRFFYTLCSGETSFLFD